MSSSIEWTDETWNPTTGCTKVSPGCAHCYIERTPPFRMAGRKFQNGKIPLQLHPDRLDKPLRWRKPRRVFVNSLSDLFHPDVPDDFIDRVFAVMAIAERHTFQILTKRPGRMWEYLASERKNGPACEVAAQSRVARHAEEIAASRGEDVSSPWWDLFLEQWPPPNVWLGTSVENQQTADERIPLLLQCPAALLFLSGEPLLGAIDLKLVDPYPHREGWPLEKTRAIGWVIAGGESGPGARPCHPDDVRSLRDQCVEAGDGVPFFFKQWGEYLPFGQQPEPADWSDEVKYASVVQRGQAYLKVHKKAAGRLLDGREWNEFPESFQRREVVG